MKNIFKETIFNKVKYSKFDLSHDRKFSCDMGELVPIMCTEVLPGDRFTVQTSQHVKFLSLLAPMMHRVDVFTHYFFVPNRLVWKGWEEFASPSDPSNVPAHPTIKNPDGFGGFDVGSLADYLSIPTGSSKAWEASALPIAGYHKIYNEYYRDQNLVPALDDECTDGDNGVLANLANRSLLKRAWDHDYFTACLPFAQKGDPVTLPLGDTAPINYKNSGTGSFSRDPVTGALLNAGANADIQNDLNTAIMEINNYSGGATDQPMDVDNSKALEADLSQATASNINDLRRAFRLQEWLEKNARGGTRYIENIFAHFGVKSSDKRLQRPEYLGGGKSPVNISEVMQTSATSTEPSPLGSYAGYAVNAGETNQFSKRFNEHGFIFGIMSVMPKTAYYQGLPKMYQRRDTLDYPFPTFAHIGEQEVLNSEVHVDHIAPNDTFGYIPRYSEMRYIPSSVHGYFRTSLDFWHMARNLPTNVGLNSDFINCDATKRIFAVEAEDENALLCHVYNDVSAVRPLPKYGVPKGV